MYTNSENMLRRLCSDDRNRLWKQWLKQRSIVDQSDVVRLCETADAFFVQCGLLLFLVPSVKVIRATTDWKFRSVVSSRSCAESFFEIEDAQWTPQLLMVRKAIEEVVNVVLNDLDELPSLNETELLARTRCEHLIRFAISDRSVKDPDAQKLFRRLRFFTDVAPDYEDSFPVTDFLFETKEWFRDKRWNKLANLFIQKLIQEEEEGKTPRMKSIVPLGSQYLMWLYTYARNANEFDRWELPSHFEGDIGFAARVGLFGRYGEPIYVAEAAAQTENQETLYLLAKNLMNCTGKLYLFELELALVQGARIRSAVKQLGDDDELKQFDRLMVVATRRTKKFEKENDPALDAELRKAMASPFANLHEE